MGDYYQFSLTGATTSLKGLVVSFDATSSSTGPAEFKIAYSTDGVNFTDFGTYSVQVNAAPNPVWNPTTSSSVYTKKMDFGTISVFDTATSVYIRLIDAFNIAENGGTVAASGTSSVDNFSFNSPSTSVPEPSSMILGALALGGLCGTRPFRSRTALSKA